MELEQFKTWANEKSTETFAIDEMEFYANIPSILECEHCNIAKRQVNVSTAIMRSIAGN